MIQNRATIIGITGGIATGKSTFCNLLSKLGFLVIDSDKIARDVVEIGSEGLKNVVDYFGDDILKEDGSLDRNKLGDLIFNDEKKRIALNNILHPLITKKIRKLIDDNINTEKVIFIDIPLLLEVRSNLEKNGLDFDQVWLIYSKESTQVKRLMDRNNLSQDQALMRIKSQMNIEEKRKLADLVINNEGSLEELEQMVERVTLIYR